MGLFGLLIIGCQPLRIIIVIGERGDGGISQSCCVSPSGDRMDEVSRYPFQDPSGGFLSCRGQNQNKLCADCRLPKLHILFNYA